LTLSGFNDVEEATYPMDVRKQREGPDLGADTGFGHFGFKGKASQRREFDIQMYTGCTFQST
jgi:hypothetical protein